MSCSGSNESGSERGSYGRGRGRGRRHGGRHSGSRSRHSYDRPCLESFRGEEGPKGFWEHFMHRKSIHQEIKMAVAILFPDIDPFHQAVMFHLIKFAIKKEYRGPYRGGPCQEKPCEEGPCPKEEFKRGYGKGRRGFFKRMMREGGCDKTEKVKMIAKMLLEKKERIIETIDLIMSIFKMQRGGDQSLSEDSEKEMPRGKGIFPKVHKRFAKEVARLMEEMCEKGICEKEAQRKMITEFWEGLKKDRMKMMKKQAKYMIRKILDYKLDKCDQCYERAVEKTICKAFGKYFRMKFAFRREKFEEMKEKFEKEGRPESGPWGRGMGHGMGRGMGHGMGHGMGREMFGMGRERFGMGRGMFGMGHGRHGGRKMMKMIFMSHIMREGTQFVLEYLGKNHESLKTCFEAVKPLVEEYCKNIKCECPKTMKKMISKIVAKAMCAAGDEKKPNTFYADFAKSYIKGCICPCGKCCIKKCRELFSTCMLFNGIKDECASYIGSRWGATMCCQVNAKDKCPSDVCAEYAKKWIDEHKTAVLEAVETIKEIKEEFKKIDKCKKGKGNGKCKFLAKMAIQYLGMNCVEAKFDKSVFKAYLKERKERMLKAKEAFKKEWEEKCPKPEEKK